jgi:hypothetical protein
VWPVACLSKPRPQPLNKSQVAPFKHTRTGECERRLSCPSPSDAPKGWTSRPSRPKMHVQPSTTTGQAFAVSGRLPRSRAGVSIQSKEDRGGGLWGASLAP